MDKLLTYNELSQILKVAKRTLQYWVMIGHIPHFKLAKKNGSVRFSLKNVEEWLKTKYQEPRRQ